jgi:ATP-dependent helicase/nuclease subunit A
MSETAPREIAARAQREASDPAASAWVGASAGSGKTKVLTDRLLRLLLGGVAPGRLLCLTFTKAAAAEMQARLGKRLGAWATMADAALEAELRDLGCAPDAALRETARRLFVEVLEQPGGMRIATIHAFCQALLRRFPVEAGLAPEFGVVEEAEGRAMLAAEREAVLADPHDPTVLDDLAKLVPPEAFAQLMERLVRDAPRLQAALRRAGGVPELRGEVARALGLGQGEDEATLLAEACRADLTPVRRAAATLCGSGNANDRARGLELDGWLSDDHAARVARWDEWVRLFLTEEGTLRKRFATKEGLKAQAAIVQDLLSAEGERVLAVETARDAARKAAATAALVAMAAPVLDRFGEAKRRAGRLDYDDMIARAGELLRDPGAEWVLYKLDHGIAHVLLDEAQDSNPAQWGIVRRLTGEFFAGAGSEEQPRSIFAVGDEKQSIYGFQGADTAGFAREREALRSRAAAAEAAFRAVPLNVSFRSTAPILALVDQVFAQPEAAAGVVAPGERMAHLADRQGAAGAVELWPPLQPVAQPALEPWAPPEAPVEAETPAALLARAVAERIARMIGRETLPARRERGAGQPEGRPVRAGDILILLRNRAPLAPLLVRELKARGVAVGGADRLALAEQLAVRDCLALCDSLLLPADDLALAAALKSPLIGLDEAALYELAQPRPRGRSLWEALAAHRAAEGPLGRIADWLAALAERLDRVGPHGLLAALLEEAGPLDPRPGRARLLARLGPDAAEPLDEMLEAALAHERRAPPSLTLFLQHLRLGGAEVKREADAAGDAVRIMTVHGAKGLQAPIVFLPDTFQAGRERGGLVWLGPPAREVPVWRPRASRVETEALEEARGVARETEAEEENRLLYVALTRAEDRLVVCGWQGDRPRTGVWYEKIAAGFAALPGVEEAPFEAAALGVPAEGFGAAPLRRLATPQTAAPREEDPPRDRRLAALPDALRVPAREEAGRAPLSPSRLEGPPRPASPAGEGDPTGLRFRRGRLLHALLQHLPAWPEEAREAAARRFLARAGHGLDAAAQAEALGEALAVLAHPALAGAFAPGSLAEAPLAGCVAGLPLAGTVDRLAVSEGRVLVLDYKTNRPPPETPEGVPPLYLRQMAAYRDLLRSAFPGRAVEAVLVWTYGARVMPLPDRLLDEHAPNAWLAALDREAAAPDLLRQIGEG